MNIAILKGRLGSDPDLRYTAKGTAVAKFSLATDERWGDREETEWHYLVVWGKLAEICSKYLFKGQEAVFVGRTRTESWEKDGVKHQRKVVVVDKMYFCGSTKARQAPEDDFPF